VASAARGRNDRWLRGSRPTDRSRAVGAELTVLPVRRRWALPVLAGALVVMPAALAALHAAYLPNGQAIGWLAVGPLLASLAFSGRGTAAIGGYTVAVAVLLMAAQPASSTAGDFMRLGVVLALSIFAVVNCVLRERREAQLRQIGEVAQVAQDALVNPVPPRAGGWRFATRYHSAADLAQVGGDFLEVAETETGVRAVLGDVRGKGLPGVRLATTVLTAFRQGCLQPGASLVDIARLVDEAVTGRAAEEDFVTAVFIESDDQGWLQVVNCGHPPPLLLPRTGELRALSPDAHASPLGLAPRLRVQAYPISPGDRLLLYTDGLMDARDRYGAFFDLAAAWRQADGASLEHTLDRLVDAVANHVGGTVDDDLAILIGRSDERPTPAHSPRP
jgi:phosphoserine phosphatase RsbU/P